MRDDVLHILYADGRIYKFWFKTDFLFKYIDAHRCYMCSLKLWLYRVLKLLLKYVSHSTFVVVVYVCSCLSLLDGVV